MKIHCQWLSDFVELPSLGQVIDRLTGCGIEVEEVFDPSQSIKGVVTAQVKSVQAHPNSDHLHVCEVTDGRQVQTVVCGAANVAAGQIVAWARPGAILPKMVIQARPVRGVESQGMLCSRMEMGLATSSDGIWVLPADTLLGSNIMEALQISPVLSLGITPNRPDCKKIVKNCKINAMIDSF